MSKEKPYEYVSDLIRYFHAETIKGMQDILDKGNIKADVKDSANQNAFFYVDSKEIAAIDFLFEQGVSLKECCNQTGKTPMFMTKNLEKIKKLANYGQIDLNKTDEHGALFFMRNGISAIIGGELDFFIKKGLDIENIPHTGSYSLSSLDMEDQGNVMFVGTLFEKGYYSGKFQEIEDYIIEEKRQKWYHLTFDEEYTNNLVEKEKEIWKQVKVMYEKKQLKSSITCEENNKVVNRI